MKASSSYEEADEDLAQAITRISEGMTALTKSGLNRKAIVVLLVDQTGLGKRDIGMVLDGLASLRKVYCK